ncbi:hypothetical protein scyTo_0004200 [Scyliorhinus torazame]|uniref:Uncharacterized protein n=1 Tax=Scyliorhinus torazame TaxID=75743 RepID=A0A401NMP4_SCYTO|nr:hypothetical protein [Scyliorhinus torazame]
MLKQKQKRTFSLCMCGNQAPGGDVWERTVAQEVSKPGQYGAPTWRDGLLYPLTVNQRKDLRISRIVSKFVIGIRTCISGRWANGANACQFLPGTPLQGKPQSA